MTRPLGGAAMRHALLTVLLAFTLVAMPAPAYADTPRCVSRGELAKVNSLVAGRAPKFERVRRIFDERAATGLPEFSFRNGTVAEHFWSCLDNNRNGTPRVIANYRVNHNRDEIVVRDVCLRTRAEHYKRCR